MGYKEPKEEGEEPVLTLHQEPELEGAAIVLESATGAIRALVGGWDYGRSKFNRAIQAKRQVGSAFKPFVWAAALEMGYTPADTIFDSPTVYEGAEQVANYSPRNNSRKYYGIVTLRRALLAGGVAIVVAESRSARGVRRGAVPLRAGPQGGGSGIAGNQVD